MDDYREGGSEIGMCGVCLHVSEVAERGMGTGIGIGSGK